MEQIGYIYKLTAPNGKVYIGQTMHLEKRMSTYARGRCKGQKKLYASIQKYGWDSFQKETIYQGGCSDKCLDRLEILFIHQYGSYRNGLNMTKGGDKPPSNKGKPNPKVSAALKGKPQSPEHKTKRSAALKGRPQPSESLAKRCKPVSQYTKGGEWIRDWSSAKEAGEALSIGRSDIAGCCKGRRKSVGGYIWKYKS